MRNRIVLVAALVVCAIALNACSASVNTNVSTNTNTAKPANSNAGASNANASSSTAKPPEPKTDIKDSKKPEGQSKTVPSNKKVPVPADWEYYSDQVKGYGFSLPKDSVGDSATVNGTDVFVAKVPPPSDVRVEVYAWKDKTLTKEDLLNMTVNDMKEQGENVTAGTLQGESDDYALAEASSVDSDGKKYKMKILVGTDVTDNYVMVVWTPEDKYEANKDIVDAIWGSFEMYSGGASGNS